MSDNWNAKGPIVVWEYLGCEGWHPRSYPDLPTALRTAGITESHVVTITVDVAVFVKDLKIEALIHDVTRAP